MEPNTQNTNPTNPQSSNKSLVVTTAILIPVIAAGYLLFGKSNNAVAPTSTSDDENTAIDDTSTPADETMAPATDSKYKDGTYSVKGNYTSPAGPEEFPVTITLASDIIVDASIEVNSENAGSKNFQTQFKDNFKEFVISKNIDEVNLSKVSGSSLTPKGFNDALAKVKTQAKS